MQVYMQYGMQNETIVLIHHHQPCTPIDLIIAIPISRSKFLQATAIQGNSRIFSVIHIQFMCNFATNTAICSLN